MDGLKEQNHGGFDMLISSPPFAALLAASLFAPVSSSFETYSRAHEDHQVPQPVINGKRIPQPPQEFLQREPQNYKAARGKDVIVDPSAVEPVFRTRGSDLPSSSARMNRYEKSMCNRYPVQCGAYVSNSAAAIKATESNAAVINEGKTSAARDNRKQGFRHQYWFATLERALGFQAAFNWGMGT